MVNKLNLNWPEFLEKYWQKKPVVLKNAFPNFVDPITPDELAGLAMEPEIDSRLVSFTGNKWQASHGPFEDFSELGEEGWSLLVQAVNHWHMPAAELVKPFRVFAK
ncbi:Cupin superfamily protein [Proteus penneri]|nr:Cupin superfamily protein [Proteus penneri]